MRTQCSEFRQRTDFSGTIKAFLDDLTLIETVYWEQVLINYIFNKF